MKVERQSFCLEERDPKSGFSDSMADTTMLKEGMLRYLVGSLLKPPTYAL